MTRVLLSTVALFCALHSASAQLDTLAYDGLASPADGQLLAATIFPGELDAIFTARFTPTEKCTLEALLVGCSVVRFSPTAPPDTLLLWVYETGPVPPALVSLVRTYRVPIGVDGFPVGNVNYENPLGAGARGLISVPLTPGIVFSPVREFVVGVRLQSRQRYVVGTGLWSGFSILTIPFSPQFQRYHRYTIADRASDNRLEPAAGGLNSALLLRAVVRYDASLPVTRPTAVETPPAAGAPSLEQNAPNPWTVETTVPYEVPADGMVRVEVVDLTGRVVHVAVDGRVAAGRHRARIPAGDLVPGTYLVRLRSGGVVRTRVMTLLR